MTERAVRELIVQGSSQLEAAHVPSPRVDAELLMAHTLGVERSQLIVSRRCLTSRLPSTCG